MRIFISMAVASMVVLGGCGSSDSNETPAKSITFNTKEKLGQALFFDANLSKDRKTSCSTCHNPEHGFIDARFREDGVNQTVFVHGALSVGDDGSALGGRNAPTASYAMFSPTFYKMSDGNYKGGQFHDGRAATLAVQAGGPPLDGAEMQMSDKNAVVDRIKENEEYVVAFKKYYGSGVFDDVNASYEGMAESIATFEKTDEFAPFDSKYDRFRDCRERGGSTSSCLSADKWTLDEEAGYALFFSNANTNCAVCHSLDSTSETPLGSHEMFSNYEYENIGTPRNIVAMDARAALGFQDKNATFRGLGGTVESSDTNYESHLGKTKVPTLRNIAVTGPYMNNGVFSKLRTVLEFYDHLANLGHHINPETRNAWISNDNNETINRAVLTDTKALTDRKIMQLEAFLNTLTDKKYESLIPTLAPEGNLGN